MDNVEFDPHSLERCHKLLLRDFTHKYRNRLCVATERDHYLDGMREFLESTGIHYARVPLKSSHEVYYFFFNLEDTICFIKKYEELNPNN